MGDAELPVDLGGDERRPQTGENEPVDRRGVDIALYHDPPAIRWPGGELAGRVGEAHADRVVSAGSSVDQEPATPGAPGVRGEALSALEWRRLRADVDPLDARRDIVEDGGLPERCDQAGIGSGALVPRDVEPPRVASHVRDDRVEVGRFRLISHLCRVYLRGVAGLRLRLLRRAKC